LHPVFLLLHRGPLSSYEELREETPSFAGKLHRGREGGGGGRKEDLEREVLGGKKAKSIKPVDPPIKRKKKEKRVTLKDF